MSDYHRLLDEMIDRFQVCDYIDNGYCLRDSANGNRRVSPWLPHVYAALGEQYELAGKTARMIVGERARQKQRVRLSGHDTFPG